MSGSSQTSQCPNCENEMDTYVDWKPYDMVSGECLECGFSFNTRAEYMDLEDVNSLREDRDMPKLNQLPEQDSQWL
jgi:Zn ribbon nucleic-acid-binding protein